MRKKELREKFMRSTGIARNNVGFWKKYAEHLEEEITSQSIRNPDDTDTSRPQPPKKGFG
jgi:hypothetical protein